jgi:hypothetical protein
MTIFVRVICIFCNLLINLATPGREKISVCHKEMFLRNFIFEMWIQKFLFLNFEQNWSYKPEGMEKIEKKFNLEI